MAHHCARLIAVAIATVSFSPPITAQQEQAPSPTLETLVETLGGRVSQNEQGEVVGVFLPHGFGMRKVTDAGLAHLAGLTALEELDLSYSQVPDAGLAHLAGLTALETLYLPYSQEITDAGVAKIQKALPNCSIDTLGPVPDPISLPPFPPQ